MRSELEGSGLVEQRGRRLSRLEMLMTGEGEMLVMETGAIWILEEAAGYLSPLLTCMHPSKPEKFW